MRKIRITLAQIDPTVGNIEGNYKKIVFSMEKAKEIKSDFIIFPELALVGYPPEDLLLNSDFIKASSQFVKKIANISKDIVVLLGAPFLENSNLFNACFVIQNKKVKYVYKKIFLPNYSVFDEKRYFSPGDKIPIFFNSQLKFAVTICEDIWEKTSIICNSSHKVDIIFNLSASPFFAGKLRIREKLLKDLSLKTDAYVVYSNLVGGQDELVFDGRSLVFSPQGKELACGKSFEEDFVVVDLDVREKKEKKEVNIIEGIKIDEFTLRRRKNIFIKRENLKESKLEEIYKALVLGTHDYVLKNGFKKAIVGLSGGIDSSLVCVIACDALGKDNVAGVSMPSQFSSQESIKDAQKLAENLGIEFFVIPIKEIFQVYKEVFQRHFKKLNDITLQNIQARIRGNILMAFSNNFGWIVLATGNKSETSVGYCTLYGDTAGGFSAIKDVPKTLVYKLARFRNKIAGFDLIPERVLKKAPSAELKSNQRDEEDLGPYKILDKIINLYVEKNWNLKRIVEKGISKKIVSQVISKIDKNEYKRRQSPPGIKITPRAFGKDRRMPITNKFVGWLR